MRFFISKKGGFTQSFPFYKQRITAFTLVEVIVVIAVVGILATVILASLGESRKKARDEQRKSDLQQVQLALRQYKDVHGRYPVYPEGTKLSALMHDYDGDAGNGKGGELESFFSSVIITDPFDTTPPEDIDTNNIRDVSYMYLYNSDFPCSGKQRAVLVAVSTEQSQNANWQAVARDECENVEGGLIGNASSGYNLTGGDYTYVIILR